MFNVRVYYVQHTSFRLVDSNFCDKYVWETNTRNTPRSSTTVHNDCITTILWYRYSLTNGFVRIIGYTRSPVSWTDGKFERRRNLRPHTVAGRSSRLSGKSIGQTRTARRTLIWLIVSIIHTHTVRWLKRKTRGIK